MKLSPTTLIPEDESWGIIFNGLRLHRVFNHYWAAHHTTLGDYIGYTVVKVNGFDVSSRQELNEVKQQLVGHDKVVFSLQNINGRFLECKDDENFVDDFE